MSRWLNRPLTTGTLAALLMGTLGSLCQAQGEPFRQREKPTIEVIRVDPAVDPNLTASTITKALRNNESFSLTVDPESKTLIFSGSPNMLSTVTALMDQLAAARQESPTSAADPLLLNQYPLRYMDAKSALNIVSTMLQGEPNTRVSADQRTNRLIAETTKAGHEIIANTLQDLDRRSPESSSETSIMKVAPVALSAIVSAASERGITFEVMPEIDLVIFRGEQKTLAEFTKVAEQVLDRAELARMENSSQNYLVRIVWMASSVSNDSLPEDLEPIRNRAAQFGIKNLSVLSQLLTTISVDQKTGGEFELSGSTADFGNLLASGSITATNNGMLSAALQISVDGNQPQRAMAQMARAEMNLTLPAGKPVMVASTPVGGEQSVFVIEIQEAP